MERKAPQTAIFILGALVGLVAGGCFLGDLGRALVAGAGNAWWPDNLPDGERAESFLPHWDDYIYVQSGSGRTYAQALNPELEGSWQEVDPILVGELGAQGYSDCAEPSQPWTPAIHSPASAVHGLECGYWNQGGEFSKYAFAILENGEVWRWRSP